MAVGRNEREPRLLRSNLFPHVRACVCVRVQLSSRDCWTADFRRSEAILRFGACDRQRREDCGSGTNFLTHARCHPMGPCKMEQNAYHQWSEADSTAARKLGQAACNLAERKNH